MEIVAEHKDLLDRIVKQNAVATNLMEFFPIETDEKLKEFDAILATHSDSYIRQIKSLLAGNAERNIHQVFGKAIIMSFNEMERLRDFPNVFKAMIAIEKEILQATSSEQCKIKEKPTNW